MQLFLYYLTISVTVCSNSQPYPRNNMGVVTRSRKLIGFCTTINKAGSLKHKLGKKCLYGVERKLDTKCVDRDDSLLLQLPTDCIKAKFICRPSKRNRSPYVADIFIPSLEREAICHVPSFDLGGKCVAGSTLLVKPQRDKNGEFWKM